MLAGGSDAGKLSFKPFFNSSSAFLSPAERSFGVSACLSVGAGSNFSAKALFSAASRTRVTHGSSNPGTADRRFARTREQDTERSYAVRREYGLVIMNGECN